MARHCTGTFGAAPDDPRASSSAESTDDPIASSLASRLCADIDGPRLHAAALAAALTRATFATLLPKSVPKAPGDAP